MKIKQNLWTDAIKQEFFQEKNVKILRFMFLHYKQRHYLLKEK